MFAPLFAILTRAALLNAFKCFGCHRLEQSVIRRVLDASFRSHSNMCELFDDGML